MTDIDERFRQAGREVMEEALKELDRRIKGIAPAIGKIWAEGIKATKPTRKTLKGSLQNKTKLPKNYKVIATTKEDTLIEMLDIDQGMRESTLDQIFDRCYGRPAQNITAKHEMGENLMSLVVDVVSAKKPKVKPKSKGKAKVKSKKATK